MKRMSIHEYRKRFSQKKKSKFRNKIHYYDGHVFRSGVELGHYKRRKSQVREGILRLFLMQVKIPVSIDADSGKAIHFVVDWIDFLPGFEKYVRFRDSKGKKTDLYKLKKAQVKQLYNIEIEEEYKDGN